jgi:ATP-binding cassette, subfamily A (ABC1), member 3
LTTHFLDEAEFLADKMVIMHLGELKAEGSVSELKARLGSGYRVHILPNVRREGISSEKASSEESIQEKIKLVPDAAAAIKEMEALEREGKTHYQLTGPTIEEVFMKLAADNNSYHSKESTDREEDERSEEHSPTTAKGAQLDAAIASQTAVSAPHQIVMLFMKRLTVLKRNPMPILAALAIGIIGAGFVSLLTKGEQNAGCALMDQVAIADNQNLTDYSNGYNPLLVVGPPSALNANSLQLIFSGLPQTASETLGTGNGTFINLIHTVDSLDQFNSFMTQNQANVTPGGLWLGDSSSPPTFDYRADVAVGGGNNGIVGVYNAIFIQNVVNMLLTNTSIVSNYAVFDFPWPTTTTNNIQFVFYFGLVLAAYPAFFALYPTRERLKNVRALEYSNGVRPFPLWFAYLLFDFITVLISSAVIVIIFSASSNNAWWNLSYVFLILLLYGIASILLSYVISLFSKSQLAAFAFSAGGQA